MGITTFGAPKNLLLAGVVLLVIILLNRARQDGAWLTTYFVYAVLLMKENVMRITGQCHCGSVRYEAEADPEHVVICHCTDASV